jgi:hypothetical protein
MIKQGIKDEFKLVAAIIIDQDDEPFEHLKRLFNPVAAPFEHYEIEVHPTLADRPTYHPNSRTASSSTKRLSTALKISSAPTSNAEIEHQPKSGEATSVARPARKAVQRGYGQLPGG